LQSTVYANNAKQEYSYNSDLRLETLSIKSSYGASHNYADLDSYNYSYSPGGIIQSISRQNNFKSFEYDNLNQITEENPYNIDNDFLYDLNGNRTTESYDDDGSSVSRAYLEPTADNRLTGYNENGETVSFTYDDCGNRTECSTSVSLVNYTYDSENRMTSCQIGGSASSVTYIYDSFGRKVKRIDSNGAVCYYIYDGMDCVFELESSPMPNSMINHRWILRGIGVAPGVGNIICIKSKKCATGYNPMETVDYYHSNHRGDIVFTTDEWGNKKAELRYPAFGKTVFENNASGVKYRFSSKE